MGKQNKGITLIALVITIIVLLILAGVSVVTLTGENGILTKANTAKKEAEKAEAREKIQLEMLASVDETGKYNFNKALENLENNLGLTELNGTVTRNADGSLTVKLNGYEFPVSAEGVVGDGIETEKEDQEDNNLPETEEVGAWTKLNKVSKTGGFNSSKGVNAPKLGSELTAVTLTTDINDYKTNGTWYNYEAQTGTTENGGTSKWANAVTIDKDGIITGYYVWIPRYAYKITKGYHGIGLSYDSNRETAEAGTIEVKFLKGTTNEFADGTGTAETDPSKITYTNGVQNQWLVHPAFLSDASIGGGFGTKSGNNDGITGIWVAKFEISAYIDADDTISRETRYIPNVTAEEQVQLRVLPGMQSSTIKDVGTMYRLSYIMNRSADSHMIKNSEWGAMAYLAHSSYGRNGTEITVNSTLYSPQQGNGYYQDVYTGGSNTDTGYLSNGIQSTTGNAYGIYDVSGGKSEHVSAHYEKISDIYSYCKELGGELYTTTEMKYKNVYPKTTIAEDYEDYEGNYDLTEPIKGDAVYETSAGSAVSPWFGWFKDYCNFTRRDIPYLTRGGFGASYEKSMIGIFSFSSDNGGTSTPSGTSFRCSLIIE